MPESTIAVARLFLNTVRHLRPEQVLHRVMLQLPREVRPLQVPLRQRCGAWTQAIVRKPAPLAQPTRLREYTLHYHYGADRALIEGWIDAIRPGNGPGWEPYPLSLRLVNWSKWILSGETPSGRMLASAAAQADFLSRNLEFHLLANHLFANGVALAFAGTLFAQEAWRRQAIALLQREIPEQVLHDGGHFERSPMYHSLVLEGLLDLINLGRAYPRLLPDWSPVAGRMLGWLKQLIHPDGQIAFFNDACFGVAADPQSLFDYAARLQVEGEELELGDSGYIRLQDAGTVLIFDAGAIGPEYQPGHAHADTLSFELSHRGRRVLVNSGTSTYERGRQRGWERSTAAHNALRIDGENSSEVWAAFRVARRAYPLQPRSDGRTFVEAAHDGYKRLKNPVVHRRRLQLRPPELRVIDSIEGQGWHQVELFFHLHPQARAEIQLDARLKRWEEWTTYQPAFEVSIPKRTIVGCYEGRCPVTLESRILLD